MWDFVLLLNRYWGIVTVPGSFLKVGDLGWSSSPFTLTTSLDTPVLSSSSSNGPTTTTLTTRVVPWRFRRVDRSRVRSVLLVRVLSDGKISWVRGPKVCVILHLAQLKQNNNCSFEKKRRKKENPKERHPRRSHLTGTDPGY